MISQYRCNTYKPTQSHKQYLYKYHWNFRKNVKTIKFKFWHNTVQNIPPTSIQENSIVFHRSKIVAKQTKKKNYLHFTNTKQKSRSDIYVFKKNKQGAFILVLHTVNDLRFFLFPHVCFPKRVFVTFWCVTTRFPLPAVPSFTEFAIASRQPARFSFRQTRSRPAVSECALITFRHIKHDLYCFGKLYN